MKLLILLVGVLIIGCSETFSELKQQEQVRYYEQAKYWELYCKEAPCDYKPKENK